MIETTTKSLRFFAAGVPAPQGSKKPIVRHGKAVMVEMSKGLAPWRASVAEAGRCLVGDDGPIDDPVLVAVVFVMPRPKRLAKVHPTPRFVKTPDLDKLQRGLGDALVSGGVLTDDNLIDQWLSSKRYAEPNEPTGAWVSVFTGPVAVMLNPVPSVAS